MSFLSVQHSLLGVWFISRSYFCKPPKSRHSEELASANGCKRASLFFGLASYYHYFIPTFAAIAKCLHDLVGQTNVKRKTKKKPKAMTRFNWTGEHQEAFDLLKTHLCWAIQIFQDISIWKLIYCCKGWVLFFLREMRMAKAGLSHMPVDPCDWMNKQCKIIVQPS